VVVYLDKLLVCNVVPCSCVLQGTEDLKQENLVPAIAHLVFRRCEMGDSGNENIGWKNEMIFAGFPFFQSDSYRSGVKFLGHENTTGFVLMNEPAFIFSQARNKSNLCHKAPPFY
jgi:hypothetical protein